MLWRIRVASLFRGRRCALCNLCKQSTQIIPRNHLLLLYVPVCRARASWRHGNGLGHLNGPPLFKPKGKHPHFQMLHRGWQRWGEASQDSGVCYFFQTVPLLSKDTWNGIASTRSLLQTLLGNWQAAFSCPTQMCFEESREPRSLCFSKPFALDDLSRNLNSILLPRGLQPVAEVITVEEEKQPRQSWIRVLRQL